MSSDRLLKWFSKYWLIVLLFVALVASPFLIPTEYFEKIRSYITEENPAVSLLAISFLLILSTVIAPLSTLTLVPFSSALFGWEIIFVTLIVSWTLGATIAFLIARRFGQPALKALGIFDEVMSFASRIPQEHIFTAVVLLRIFIPVDILSYAIGLVSSISLFRYILATAIGITPFSFIWSFAGEAAISKEYLHLAIIAGVGLIIALFAFYFLKKQNRDRK